MEKEFRCHDLGLDCDFIACGRNEEELMRKAELHAEKSHGMQFTPDEIFDNGAEAVREVPVCSADDEI